MVVISDVVQPRKLPLSVAWRAVAFPFAHFYALMKLGLLPSLISFAIYYGAFRLLWPHREDPNSLTGQKYMEYSQELQNALSVSSILADISSFVVFVIFAVGIHRYIIDGERSGWIVFRIRVYEIVYAISSIALYLLTNAIILGPILIYVLLFENFSLSELNFDQFKNTQPSVPILIYPIFVAVYETGIFRIVYGLIFIVAVILYVRLALAFPHAAVTGKLSLGFAWHALKGNFRRFVTALILFLLMLSIFYIIHFSIVFAWMMLFLEHKISSFDFFNEFALVASVLTFIYGFIVAMLVALISYTYKELVKGVDLLQASRE